MAAELPNDQRKIWAHFQNTVPESFAAARPRLRFLMQQIVRRAPSGTPKVLNIGIGDGYLEREGHAHGWDVHSLDPDPQAAARLSEAGITAVTGHIERLPYDDATFDFVVASEVLEHLTESQRSAGIAEIHRVLRRGGAFIGTVPHAENLAEQQAVCPHCGDVFHRWGHQASFTPESVRLLLSRQFALKRLARTAFVDFAGRGFKGFLKGSLRILLAKLGEPIAVPTIWWIGIKR